MIFDLIKKKKVKKIYVKMREDGDFFVVTTQDLDIYYLNATGGFFLQLCNEKRTINEIFYEMLNVYEISHEQLRKDIVNLVRDLQWKKIIILEG